MKSKVLLAIVFLAANSFVLAGDPKPEVKDAKKDAEECNDDTCAPPSVAKKESAKPGAPATPVAEKKK